MNTSIESGFPMDNLRSLQRNLEYQLSYLGSGFERRMVWYTIALQPRHSKFGANIEILWMEEILHPWMVETWLKHVETIYIIEKWITMVKTIYHLVPDFFHPLEERVLVKIGPNCFLMLFG